VVEFVEFERMVTRVPDELAETPIFCRFVSALTALARAVAIEVRVSPLKRCN